MVDAKQPLQAIAYKTRVINCNKSFIQVKSSSNTPSIHHKTHPIKGKTKKKKKTIIVTHKLSDIMRALISKNHIKFILMIFKI